MELFKILLWVGSFYAMEALEASAYISIDPYALWTFLDKWLEKRGFQTAYLVYGHERNLDISII